MSVTWSGLDAYERELAAWPAATAHDAATHVETRARAAFSTVRAGYPVVTGTLRDGLRLANTTRDPLQPHWTLRNDVVYARIWESGGMTTGGPQAPGKLLIPTSMRERRAMVAEVVEVVRATGAVAVR